MFKHWFTAALLSVATCAATAANLDVVRLGNLKFASYGAVSYMKEIAPKYGLKIEERMFAKGVDILPAIVAGEIDVGASAADGAVAGRAAGVPIYVVAGFAKGGARLVAAAGSGIKTIEGLKGKKVGVPRGGAHELLLLAELAKHHLTWSDQPGKDVQLVYLGYPDLNPALLTKQIDAMCQSEPQSAQAISKKFGVEVMKPYDTALGEPIRTLTMTEKMYKERPDVALRFIKVFEEATRTFLAHPDLAENYVRQNMFKGQLTHQDYLDGIANAPFSDDISIQHIAVTTDLMRQFGVGRLTNAPKAEDWVKLDLLEKAKRELVAQK